MVSNTLETQPQATSLAPILETANLVVTEGNKISLPDLSQDQTVIKANHVKTVFNLSDTHTHTKSYNRLSSQLETKKGKNEVQEHMEGGGDKDLYQNMITIL